MCVKDKTHSGMSRGIPPFENREGWDFILEHYTKISGIQDSNGTFEPLVIICDGLTMKQLFVVSNRAGAMESLTKAHSPSG